MVHFHLSLSGCSMGSLETCTHVILKPESHIDFSLQMLPPTHKKGDENVVISGMCRLKGDKNVVISGMCRLKGDKNVVNSGIHKEEEPLV